VLLLDCKSKCPLQNPVVHRHWDRVDDDDDDDDDNNNNNKFP
jgi:hypothetical protein